MPSPACLLEVDYYWVPSPACLLDQRRFYLCFPKDFAGSGLYPKIFKKNYYLNLMLVSLAVVSVDIFLYVLSFSLNKFTNSIQQKKTKETHTYKPIY